MNTKKTALSDETEQHGHVVVIGLGYIGLPTAIVLADNGWQVTGVDVSDRTVNMVNRGELPFVEEGMGEALSLAVESKSLTAQKTTPDADIYIISVPTPFKGDHEADLSYIDAACDGIAPMLKGDELIVLESTAPPGATEHMANHILAARPDLSIDGANACPIVHFAHAPERVLPGRIMVEMVDNDRIIGGLTPKASQMAKDVYSTFCKGELSVTDAKTAEMAKLTENAFRDVNIAFANELSLISDQLGINVWELIEIANKHPRVNILQPGPGVGGHCIAVDPWFIVSSDRKNSKLISTARAVNDNKPQWVIHKVEKAMQNTATDAPIALLGLAFKPDIDDLRESPALNIAVDLIKKHPNRMFYISEPFIETLPDALTGFTNTVFSNTQDAIDKSDIVVLLVDHTPYKDIENMTNTKHVVDTRGMWIV